jgi:hypothetical protein
VKRQRDQGRQQLATAPWETICDQTKFEGKCNDLKGHIYDCSDSRQANQFTKTTKEIQEYVGRTFKGGGNTRLIFDSLTLPVIPPRSQQLSANSHVGIQSTCELEAGS